MSKWAFVFPGQGAQAVGMARDVYEASADARILFQTADETLGFALSDLIFNGPESDLKKTYHTQPALLTASLVLLQAVHPAAVQQAAFFAGHSLGEYSALVAAGALTFSDAVATVRARGQFMEQAVPEGRGAMAAVLGADRDVVIRACAQITASGTSVQPANLNCPGQIVISGTQEGVQAFIEQGKELGAKRVLKLEVSGPFHSALMEPAALQLQTVLDGIEIMPTQAPVVANVTAEPVELAADIRRLLVEQVCAPVRWEDSVRRMIELGVDTFVEVGPGNVLSGLIKKIDGDVRIFTLNSLEAVRSFNESFHESFHKSGV
jgi:[acyl-carrier-protein] S-malonyltransferase